ncbi:SDR family NAD(P)-dependent oxidoreductase [Lysobacter korlensis]|uniref:SDR family NAD(P)-dependent oxidoreductase n=1 Tax=Lysobacter korlensis TaxID=553636 RepID=A0ABV6RZ11_9GAMM
MDRPCALITGATAGLGAEFANQLAASGHDLVLVARNAERLKQRAVQLTERYGVDVQVIPADLTDPAGLAKVEARVRAAERPVSILVNNAGYGLLGQFERNSVEQEEHHLALHVRATLRLMHAALQQMLPRRAGTILNVASVAGFTPRGSYGAAKAWVLSFSRWANWYYKSRGVQVSAVAPGFVHTEFHSRMGARKEQIPGFLWLDAPRVVRTALDDARRGKAVSVPSLRYKLIVAFTKMLPTSLVAAGSLTARPTD